MKIFFKSIATFIVVAISFTMCTHQPSEIYIGSGKDTTHSVIKDTTKVTPPANDSVCFNTQILPLITASCAQSGCHDATSHVEGLRLNSYSGIKSMGTTTLVSYITRTTGKVMPPAPQPHMDTANINLIKRWISQGARNTICNTSNCDTVSVTYQNQISSVINIYCKGCHNLNNKSGNVNLDNFSDTKTQTLTGKLICTISNNGCSFMPQGGNSLSSCDIRKIKIWAANNCPQ